MNQVRIQARDPETGATASAVVNRRKFETQPDGVAGLCGLLQLGVVNRGGRPDRVVYTAEPVGPQLELAAVNGHRL